MILCDRFRDQSSMFQISPPPESAAETSSIRIKAVVHFVSLSRSFHSASFLLATCDTLFPLSHKPEELDLCKVDTGGKSSGTPITARDISRPQLVSHRSICFTILLLVPRIRRVDMKILVAMTLLSIWRIGADVIPPVPLATSESVLAPAVTTTISPNTSTSNLHTSVPTSNTASKDNVPTWASDDVIMCDSNSMGWSQQGPDDGMITIACCPKNTGLSKSNSAKNPLECSYSWFSVPVVRPLSCADGTQECTLHPHACCRSL